MEEILMFEDKEKKLIAKAINKALWHTIREFHDDEIDFLNKLENKFKYAEGD